MAQDLHHVVTAAGLLLALAFAGCIDDTDLRDPGERSEAQNGYGDAVEDEAAARPWTHDVRHEGQVEPRLCGPVEEVCASAGTNNDTLSVVYDNATILGVEVTVSFQDDESISDWTLTLTCDDSDGGDCSRMEEPLTETFSESPFTFSRPSVHLDWDTRLDLTVGLQDHLQNPMVLQYDTVVEFQLEARFELHPSPLDEL